MEYAKDKMSLEEGIKREWIITNGLGGYCSCLLYTSPSPRDTR